MESATRLAVDDMKRSVLPRALRIALLGLACAGMALPAGAADTGPAALRGRPYEITLNPGQSYTTEVLAFCMNYGRPFPSEVALAASRAPDPTVRVLQQAVESTPVKGALGARGQITTLYQIALAVWQSFDQDDVYRDFAARDYDLAERIFNASIVQTVPITPVNAFFLQDYAGLIETTFSALTPITDSEAGGQPYVGTADMTVRNASSRRMKVAIVPGAVLAPVGGEREQRLAMIPQHPKRLPTAGGDLARSAATLPLALILAGAAMMFAGALSLARRHA